ncbi:helix-turn-helix domain-containing protein [Streptomyces sp. NPDC056503]|uniref:nSTAND1 domain-containing NTPase n=1 Tax=Streptomyces sp. NPDC056503 TaxID=3345842 RepID=UPI0036BFA5E8
MAEFAYALRRLRQDAGGPPYSAMARRSGAYSVTTYSRAAGGEQLPTLPVVLAYVAACGGDREEWEARWRRASEEAVAGRRPGADEPSPYRGLARFETGDSALFFGRDRAVADLLGLAGEHRLVCVFGASGSGKSSLLRAGLIPRLRDPERAGERPAAVRILTPGERPFTTHGPALVAADSAGDTWLVVDQFEEVFTLCHDAVERTRFIEALLAAGRPTRRLRVVLGIRADFYPHCLEHAGLADAIRAASLPMVRMTQAELREAICGPAAARRLVVERALTDALVEEVSGQTGGLPMLSHALLETWRRRSGRTLTLEAYQRVGGMRGAIAQSAEAAYSRLDPGQAETARQIMLRLITPGKGAVDTRRPAARTEVTAIGNGDGEARAVLETLARARLIIVDGDRVELAHETLITAWPRLQGWIEQDRETLRVHRWLTEAADAWEAVGRDPGVRISPVRLAQLGDFETEAGRSRLTGLEADFIAAGLATHHRTIRNRQIIGVVIPLLSSLAVVSGVVAWQQRRRNNPRTWTPSD